MFTYAQFEEAF